MSNRGARWLAKQSGAKRYVTRIPCSAGHTTERWTANAKCVECHKLKGLDPNVTAQRRTSARKWQRNPANKEVQRANDRRHSGLPEPTRASPDICECCGRPPQKYALCVDHVHGTKIFRGWLCHRCNSAIGLLGDNIEGVRAALVYLTRSSADLI